MIAGHDFSFALIVDDPDRAVAFPTRPQHIGNGFRAVRYIAHGHMQAFFRGLGLRLRDARGIEFFVASQGGRMLVEQAVPNGAIVFALLLVFRSAQRIGRALIRTPVPALPDMRDPGTNVLARVRVVGFVDRPEPRQQRVRCLFRQRSGNALRAIVPNEERFAEATKFVVGQKSERFGHGIQRSIKRVPTTESCRTSHVASPRTQCKA